MQDIREWPRVANGSEYFFQPFAADAPKIEV